MPPRVEQPTDDAISKAADLLHHGGVVAFPTETVYGLGADAANPEGLRRIFQLKARPADNPLIVHVRDPAMAQRVVARWPESCDALAANFWPGPLTLVLPKAVDVPAALTAARPTVAVRCPDHRVAHNLMRAFGGAIAAPSANRSGHVSPTEAEHVALDFKDCDDLLILDGGPCQRGIESTVLDMTSSPPRILRPGSVSAEQVRAVIGDVDLPTIDAQSASPGTSPSHYAPRTPARLVSRDDLYATLESLAEPAIVLCCDPTRVPQQHRAVVMPTDATEYAAQLYRALRDADAQVASQIIIEKPTDDTGLWSAILDRLRRATHRARE